MRTMKSTKKNGEIPSLSLLFPIDKFPDRSAKWLLESPFNVKGLLEIVAADLVDMLDFDKLRHVNTSFIPDNLREQESDIICLVPFRGEDTVEVLVYILIEHQSTVDVSMGFRILFYMVQIWDAQRREWEDKQTPKSQWRFRPIVPIVFYTGEQRWEVPLSVNALMELPDALRRFVPTFDTLLLEVKAEDEASLTRTDHPFGWLMTVLKKEQATKEELAEALEQTVSHISALPASERNQFLRAIHYLYLLILSRRPPDEHDDLKSVVYQHITNPDLREESFEMAQTMAEHLLQQGEQRGIEIGSLQAKRQDIVELLQIRFDSVSATIVEKVNAIDSLKRLNEVFRQAAMIESIDQLQLDDTAE